MVLESGESVTKLGGVEGGHARCGFPLREVSLPWAAEQGIAEPVQLDNRVRDRFAVHLRDHGGKRWPLSEHSIWTYVKAVTASSAG